MARSRLLKPDFFEDEKVATLPFGARLLFQACWCLADRDGRLEDRPTRIAAFAFPPMGNERQQASARRDVPEWLEALIGAGMLQRYEVGGEFYLCIPHWKDHQKIHEHEAKSLLPEPMSDIGIHRDTLDHFGENVAGSSSNTVSTSTSSSEAEAVVNARARDDLPPSYVSLKGEVENTLGLAFVPPAEIEGFREFCRALPKDWISASIKQTRGANRPSYAYMKRILEDCVSTGDPPSSIKPPAKEKAKSLRYQEVRS